MSQLLRVFLNNEQKILTYLAILAISLGLYGFYISEESKGIDILTHTMGLFYFSWTDDDNIYVNIAQFLAPLLTFVGIISIFFKDQLNNLIIKDIQNRDNFYLVIGIDEQNITLINNIQDIKANILIIGDDLSNPYIDDFKIKGFGVIIGNPQAEIKKLKLDLMKYAIISSGEDRLNIALAKDIYHQSNPKKYQNIHTRVDNNNLNVLFKQKTMTSYNEKKININIFSIYENMSKLLFSEYSILGTQIDIAKTSNDYNIVILGNSQLVFELVYHISLLSHLPNQNKLTIHCIDKEASKLLNTINLLFPNISAISNIDINIKEFDNQNISFYKDEIWQIENLTNIYIATDNEETNLNIAMNLQNITYLKNIDSDRLKTDIFIALYSDMGLGEVINRNNRSFANFYTFANIAECSTQGIIIDEKLDKIAKFINYDYDGNKEIDIKEMEKSFVKLSLHKKDSNKTQALHLDMKLLVLGLKKVEDKDKSKSELLAHNRKMLEIGFKNSNSTLEYYNDNYFPENFEDELINKMARAEHNRWNAFHYVNGWSYNKIRNDNTKEHNSLKPIEEFSIEEQKTYKYDLASIYNIPKYLANIGYIVTTIPIKKEK